LNHFKHSNSLIDSKFKVKKRKIKTGSCSAGLLYSGERLTSLSTAEAVVI